MMNVDSIDALIDLLLGDGAQRSDFVGCNDVEIEQIRVAQGIAMLPPSYEEFLKVMGHGAGRFLVGTDIFYPHPIELKEDARDLLGENGVEDFLGDSDVVFSMHQGYLFTWMTSGDPIVRLYSEGYPGVRRTWDSLPRFLADAR